MAAVVEGRQQARRLQEEQSGTTTSMEQEDLSGPGIALVAGRMDAPPAVGPPASSQLQLKRAPSHKHIITQMHMQPTSSHRWRSEKWERRKEVLRSAGGFASPEMRGGFMVSRHLIIIASHRRCAAVSWFHDCMYSI